MTQPVGPDVAREHRAGPVLVDDGLDADQATRAAARTWSGCRRRRCRRPRSPARAASSSAGSRRCAAGSGEATTRRQRVTVRLAPSSRSAAACSRASSSVYDGTDELGRVGERRVVRVDLGHREHRRERLLERQQVAQLLLDQVADHPLGLRTRARRTGTPGASSYAAACSASSPTCGPLPWRDHELVLERERGERLAGGADVGPLALDGHRLAPALQGVASEGDHDAHAVILPHAGPVPAPVRPGGAGWRRRGRPARRRAGSRPPRG